MDFFFFYIKVGEDNNYMYITFWNNQIDEIKPTLKDNIEKWISIENFTISDFRVRLKIIIGDQYILSRIYEN